MIRKYLRAPLLIIPLFFFCIFISLKLNLAPISLILTVGMVMYMIFMDFDSVKISVRKCIAFLIVNSILGSLCFAAIFTDTLMPYLGLNIKNDDAGIIQSVLIFTFFYLIFYVIVIVKAEPRVSKLSTFIISTLVTIIYTVGSFAINIIPLSTLNESIKSINTKDMIATEAFFREYDGRVFYNIIIQMFTYPIWIVSLIGYTMVELRQYIKETDSKFKDKLSDTLHK